MHPTPARFLSTGRSRRAVALALVFALMISMTSACTTPIGRSKDAFSPQLSWDAEGPDTNRDRLRHYLESEAVYYENGAGRPNVCVSFSGGGMRSASISIGVMSGLQAAGVLEHVDVASAISGGSYALSWYLVQHADAAEARGETYDPRGVDAALFDPEGAHQERLAENFELFAFNVGTREGLADDTGSGILGGLESVWNFTVAGTATLVSIPFNLVANGVFGWHANLVPVRALYENSIERAFHANVDPEDDRLGPSFGMALTGRSEPLTWPETRDHIERAQEKGHFLFPVIAANANFDVNTDATATDRSNRLYEFTPLRHGADAIGFTDDFGDLTVGRAVAISGSAWDSAALLSGSGALFASALNTDLGYYVSNPLVRSDAATHPMAAYEHLYWVSPLPTYLAYGRWQQDPQGLSLQITDGGHTENLGVFPLARRLCDEIVVVDATGDRHHQFVDYRILRQALLSEFDMELQVDAIDDWVAVLDALEELVREERRRSGSTISIEAANTGRADRVRRSLIVLEGALLPEFTGCVPDDASVERWWEEAKLLHDAVDCQLIKLRGPTGPLDPRKARNWVRPELVFDGRAPVAGGRIRVDRGGPDVEGKNLSIGVTWIKSSLFGPSCGEARRPNQSETANEPVYAEATCWYRKHQLRWVDDKGTEFTSSRSPFPHESTGDIAYSPSQYRAARGLGRALVEWGAANAPAGSIFSRSSADD